MKITYQPLKIQIWALGKGMRVKYWCKERAFGFFIERPHFCWSLFYLNSYSLHCHMAPFLIHWFCLKWFWSIQLKPMETKSVWLQHSLKYLLMFHRKKGNRTDLEQHEWINYKLILILYDLLKQKLKHRPVRPQDWNYKANGLRKSSILSIIITGLKSSIWSQKGSHVTEAIV